MNKARKAVFALHDTSFIQHRMVELLRNTPFPDNVTIEFGRLALPHPVAKNALEVQYLLTFWLKHGRKIESQMGTLIEYVKGLIPTARYLGKSDLGLLNARVREVELPVFSEQVLHGGPSAGPWSLRYLLGAARPSLVAVVWQKRPQAGLLETLITERSREEVRAVKGRITGLVRYFGTTKFGDLRAPVDIAEPLSAATAVKGHAAGSFRVPEEFAEMLPLESPDLLLERPSKDSVPLVDRTGRACFAPAFAADTTTSSHWMLGLNAENNARLLTELRTAANRGGVRVRELTSGRGVLPAQPFVRPGLAWSRGPHLQPYLLRLFYEHILGLTSQDGDKLEAAFAHAWELKAEKASWRDVQAELARRGIAHATLDLLANGTTINATEVELSLYQAIQAVIGEGVDTPARHMVVLPNILGPISPLGMVHMHLLAEVLKYGAKAQISFVLQMSGLEEEPSSEFLQLVLKTVQFVAIPPVFARRRAEVPQAVQTSEDSRQPIYLVFVGKGMGEYRFYKRPAAPRELPLLSSDTSSTSACEPETSEVKLLATPD